MIVWVPNRIKTQKRAMDTNFVVVALSSASFSSDHAFVSLVAVIQRTKPTNKKNFQERIIQI